MSFKLVKKGSAKMGAKVGAGAAAAPTDFALVDNGDDTLTVMGVDKGVPPNLIDISTVASLTPAPTSSDPTVVTVDPPTGMTFAMHAVGKLSTPGTPVVITATATWNDGSIGPFTGSLNVDVVAGPAGGVVIQPGTVTTH